MGRRVAGSSFAEGLCATLNVSETLTIFCGESDAVPATCKFLLWLKVGAQVRS